jgi:hypothetical protein
MIRENDVHDIHLLSIMKEKIREIVIGGYVIIRTRHEVEITYFRGLKSYYSINLGPSENVWQWLLCLWIEFEYGIVAKPKDIRPLEIVVVQDIFRFELGLDSSFQGKPPALIANCDGNRGLTYLNQK